MSTKTNSNPWDTVTQTATTSTTSTTASIDMSPAAIFNRDAALAAAIRQGLIKLSFAQTCRLAVAKAAAAGLVKHDSPPGPLSN